ncbi:MAG: outer membrane beta-barrel protein, partial [Bacteroidia bacterium]
LTATLTGFSKYWYGPFEVAAGASELTIPLITLAVAAELKGVTITANQPLYVQKPDMLIMNVENSPIKMSGTVYELIQKVPGVVADQNGNITLKGRSGVQIYIDGKPTYLAGDQLRQYLEGMSAADVSRVEIITNPSAKYDAQGSGGILNIVTKNGTKQGFNGRLRLTGGYGRAPKEGLGFSMNYGMPKANIYARYDFSNWNNRSFYDSERKITYAGEQNTFKGTSDSRQTPFSNTLTLGADFNPTKKTAFGFQLRGNIYTAATKLTNLTEVNTLVQDSVFKLDQINELGDDHLNLRTGFWLNHKLDSAGKELSFSGDVVIHEYEGGGDYITRYINNNGNEITLPFIQRHSGLMKMNIYVAQLDYVHPISKKYKIESGLKSSYIKTDNLLVFDIYDANTWIKDTGRSNDFIYTEQINAAYTQVYADWEKVQLQIGLRYEHTISEGNSPTTGQRLKRNYGNLFPSIFLTQVINDNNNITYSVTRRINRPNYNDLNPFRMYLDRYSYRVGNPFLQPEIAWNADITHTFKEFVFTSVGGSRTFDAISEASDQNDSLLTSIVTTANLQTVDNFYASISSSLPIGKFWVAEGTVTFNWFSFRSTLFGGNVNTQSSMWNFSIQNTFNLPYDIKLQISGTLSTPIEYGIYSVQTRGGVNAAVSKSFLKNKLSVSINANDIFITNYPRVNVNYMNQNSYLASRYENNYVLARITWAFGNEKAARKAKYKGTADDYIQRGGM